jgi:hypothetical protein
MENMLSIPMSKTVMLVALIEWLQDSCSRPALLQIVFSIPAKVFLPRTWLVYQYHQTSQPAVGNSTSVHVNLQRPHKMHFYQLITSGSITFPQMGIFYHILVIKLVYNKVCQFAYRTKVFYVQSSHLKIIWLS